MKMYSVFLRNLGRDAASDLVFVKQGFCWPAFFFTALWALWNRMWWQALGIFAVVALAGWAPRVAGLGSEAESICSLAAALAIGFIGNDLRAWALADKGFDEVAIASGKSVDEAERRFLDDADIDANGIYA